MPSESVFGLAQPYNPLVGFQQGYGLAQGLEDDQAQREAAANLAIGNYDDAAQAYAGAGLAGQVLATRQVQNAATDRARALADDAANRQAAEQATAGDYTGALTTQAATGDLGRMQTLSDQHQAVLQHHAAFLANAADALSQINVKGADGQVDQQATQLARHTAFNDHLAPALKSFGLSDADVSNVGSDSFSDQNLASIKASVGQADQLQFMQTPDGNIVAVNKRTGKAQEVYGGAPKPILGDHGIWVQGPDGKYNFQSSGTPGEYKVVKNADGIGEHIEYANSVSGSYTGDGASGGAPSAPAPSGGNYDKIASVAQAAGATPAEVDALQRFAKKESGGNPNAPNNGSSTGLFQFHPDTFAAHGGGNIHDLGDQTKAALSTLRESEARLKAAGLPVTGANAYLVHQQNQGGIALLKAAPGTSAVDALTPIYGGGVVGQRRALQAVTGNGGSATMSAADFAAKVTAPLGYGAQTQTQRTAGAPGVTVLAGQGGAGASGNPYNIPADATGADVLKSLPTADAAMVKAYAEGRAPIPTAAALRSPKVQALMAATAQYDPTFDASNYPTRAKTRADFTSGQSAKNITSFNTAIGHLGELYDASQALSNEFGGKGPFVPANAVMNGIRSNFSDPNVTKYQAAVTAVSDELTRAFRGSGGNVHDVEAWERTLDMNKAPAARAAAIHEGVKLLASRIDSLREQYSNGMSKSVDPVGFLNPKAQSTLLRLPGGSSLLPNGLVSNPLNGEQSTQGRPDPLGLRPRGQAAPSSGGDPLGIR